MNEEQFLSSLKALNSNSLEEFYEKSLPSESKVGFQYNLFKLLAKDYSPFMIIYAFVITIYANLLAIIFPAQKYKVPEILTNKLPYKTWYQGRQENCSVVAVIKAVQARNGDDIFRLCKKNLMGYYEITLKDGSELTINDEELNLIKKEAQFIGPNNNEKEKAYLAYAVIVKNSTIRGDFNSFKSALNYFNSGAAPDYCVDMLGYLNCMMFTEPMRGLNDIIVAYSKNNAVCINNGFIIGMGDKLVFAGHDTMGKILDKAIIIV
ncbi:MAG: hypothetical protein AB1782_12665 [Cyanobacteriota bacterium]